MNSRINLKDMVIENLFYCWNIVASACQYVWFKSFTAVGLISLSFLFDKLQQQAMVAILFLIVIDFITAIWASLKIGENIESKRVLRTAIKIVAYFLLISAAYKAEVPIHIYVLDDTVIAFLAATELISVMENMSRAGYMIPQKLLKKLKEFSGEE